VSKIVVICVILSVNSQYSSIHQSSLTEVSNRLFMKLNPVSSINIDLYELYLYCLSIPKHI
jgi:hypothetical protein